MSEPIEHRSELDEAEKGDGQLLVASRDPTVAFDASEEVFDRVPVSVETPIEVIGDTAAGLRRDADHCSALGKAEPKVFRIEGPVGDSPMTVKFDLERRARPQVVLRSRDDVESDSPSDAVDHGRELCVETAFRASHCLPGLAANRIGSVPVYFDVRAVHTADPAKSCSAKLGEHAGPKAARTPSSETRVDRTPWTESGRKVPPGNSRPHDIPNGGNHASIIPGRSASFVTIGPLPFSGGVRSVFLAAPKAARAIPNDL